MSPVILASRYLLTLRRHCIYPISPHLLQILDDADYLLPCLFFPTYDIQLVDMLTSSRQILDTNSRHSGCFFVFVGYRNNPITSGDLATAVVNRKGHRKEEGLSGGPLVKHFI